MREDDEANPFDLLGVDPRSGPQALTELLRRRAERALPEERKRLQGLWRQLTLKEEDRIRWALRAHPRGASDAQIEALRQQLPPALSRYKPAPLRATTRDALTLPDTATARAPIAPPGCFDDAPETPED